MGSPDFSESSSSWIFDLVRVGAKLGAPSGEEWVTRPCATCFRSKKRNSSSASVILSRQVPKLLKFRDSNEPDLSMKSSRTI